MVKFNEQLPVRVDGEQKEAIKKSAKVAKLSVAAYIRTTLQKEASNEIRRTAKRKDRADKKDE